MFEDSYISDDRKVVSILLAAFLSQRIPAWEPPSFLIDYSFELIENSINIVKAYNFNIPRGIKIQPFIINDDAKPLEIASSLLEEIRTFGSDLGMVRDIVTNYYSGTIEYTKIIKRPEIMPLLHCIDQHWATEIAYFFPKELIRSLKTEGSRPYSGLFIKLFSEVTGVNPRRPLRKGRTMTPIGYTDDFEDKEFVKITRTAQSLVLKSKNNTKKKYLGVGGSFKLDYELDAGWISGMAGAIEIRNRFKCLVSLHPDDPSILVAVKKPSRNMKTALLDDKQSSVVINKARLLLKSGIPLNKTHPPIPELRGTQLVLYKGVYWIKKNKKMRLWDEFRRGSSEFKYIETLDLTLINALSYDGLGVVVDADLKLIRLLKEYEKSEIDRTLTYISDYSSTFEIARINKVGSGTDQSVTIDDCGAFQLILRISLLYPSAFKRVGTVKFKVLFAPLLWHIRKIVLGKNGMFESDRWGDFGERTGRTLRAHQLEALHEMKESHQKGKKGNFIYMTVGLGKTMLVLSYLKYLKEKNELPDYVLYTLPASAINSIIKEIEFFGMDYTLIIPLKGLKKCYKGKNYVIHSQKPKLKKYAINLIEHDHMRRCDEYLYQYAPKSVFIMDEVHKALNNTKRTQVALQLSTLAKEFVAMTGTPIIDTNTYKLIWWLSKIVPFEVNESNFWVAANAMVAKKINTKVKVVKNDILVNMSEKEMNEYRKHVSPKLGGINTQPRSEDIIKALEICYAISTREIIEQTIINIEKGVFVVAKDIKHQDRIELELNKRGITNVFSIKRDNSIVLTDEEVKNGDKDYRVVITTKNNVEGYTLTRLRVMISGVYPSNNAVREQLEGRINRIGQRSDKIWNITVHTGILTYILKKHNDAKNISAVLKALADDVNL